MIRYSAFCLSFVLITISAIGSQDIGKGIPSQMENELWQAAVLEQAKLEQRYSVLEHADMDLYVNGIVDRLWQYVESDLPIMQVRLLADAKADAYVFPNGVCYVTSGMLSQTANPDQLAMILAHEIIHYTYRHAMLMNSRTQRSPSLNCPIPTNLRNMDEMSSMLNQAEQQADSDGLRLLARAGYRPIAAADIVIRSRHSSCTVDAEGRCLDLQANDLVATSDNLDVAQPKSDPYHMGPSAVKGNHIKQIAPALKANARQALQHGLWELAENNIGRYLSVYPDDAQGHYIRGEIRRLGPSGATEGSPEKAYQRAIELDREFAPAYQSLGIISLKKGQMAQAKQFFEQSLSLASDTDQAAYIKLYLQWCSK